MLVSPYDVAILTLAALVVAAAYSQWLEPHNPDWYAALKWVVVLGLWGHAALITVGGVDPWLVGSAVAVHPAVGVVYVLSYPLWFGWVSRRLFVLFGRTPRQGGFLWPMTIKDRTESFERSWEK